MIRKTKTRTCKCVCLVGLMVGLVAVTTPFVVHAQSGGDINALLSAYRNSFNAISSEFAEVNFSYHGLQDERIEGWRQETCPQLQELVANRDVVSHSFSIISQEIAATQSTEAPMRIPEVARVGDRFTEFLEDEDNILQTSEFSQDARELILQHAIRFRPFVARATEHVIGRSMSSFNANLLQHGVIRLCAEEYSPAHNESTATWKSWLWHGLEFIGGSAVFLANVVANPEPTTKAMSMYLGSVVAGSGYSGLSSLMEGN